jgi:hypothetical protein
MFPLSPNVEGYFKVYLYLQREFKFNLEQATKAQRGS